MTDGTRMKQAKQREEYPTTNMPPQNNKIQIEQNTGCTGHTDVTMHVRTEQNKIKINNASETKKLK